jgi:outer membrane protein OmpA-like peptidoglycan-associated protein
VADSRVMIVHLLAVGLLFVVSPLLLHAQRAPVPTPRPISIGGYAGFEVSNLVSAFAVDSSGFIEEGECGRFEQGTGSGIVIGGSFAFIPFEGYRIAVQPELHLSTATLDYPCVDPARTRLPDGSLATAETLFKTDLSMRSIALRLLLLSTPFHLPLDFSVGPVLSLSLGGSYESWEEIASPREAEFVSGGQVRAISKGDLPTASGPSLAIGGGISYRAPIGRSLDLVPELGYMIDLGRHHAPLDLGIRSIRATLGIVYSPEVTPPVLPPPPDVPLPLPTVALSASVALNSVDPAGRLGDTLEYALRRTISTRLHPLLTYLFFDEGSDTIEERYRQRPREATARFNEAKLESTSVLETYHNLLDIIGGRLRQHPEASVTITGTQPEQVDPELKLARRRAERVAGYLESVWGIDRSRLHVVTRLHPAAQSNEETEEGREENRRVEIASARYEIVAPVLLADTTAVSVASNIRITSSSPESARVESWRLELLHGGSVAAMEGTGAPPSDTTRADLVLASGEEELTDRLEAVLRIRDAAGNEATARDDIAVRHRVESDYIDYGAGQYSLILFDFGRADLRPEHQKIVDLINSRTPDGATSTVAGFTDRLGEAALNLELSRNRATTVAKTLRGRIDRIVAEGEERLLYDNELPEGRFYSRCVTVEVRTK